MGINTRSGKQPKKGVKRPGNEGKTENNGGGNNDQKRRAQRANGC